jgi:DNA-binding NarL/FixJ family response regulator
MEAPTVLLADDHVVARRGIRADLEGFGFRICAEVGDAAAAIDAARRERPDVCLLDLRMPGGGIEAAREIAAWVPATRVVMLTASHDRNDIAAARAVGVAGYLFKDDDVETLTDAVERVAAGGTAFPGAARGRPGR